MGVAATPKYEVGAFWAHKEFGGSEQKYFDHHTFYVGYNITNVFYSVIKPPKGVWGLTSRIYF